MEKVTWRLLKTAPASGAWNMAVDEAILEAVGRGKVIPTLRLYAWEPACLSIGYAQSFSDVDEAGLAAYGWDVVRRSSGGRAILHTDELTYSVVGPEDDPYFKGDIMTSYQRISEAILAALEGLGLPVTALPQKDAPKKHIPDPVCFEIPSNYEITVDSKKLVGSAQARKKSGVLQHGTLPLCGDLSRITQGLAFPDEDTRKKAGDRLLTRAATVESVLGRRVSWGQAAEAFVEGFAEVLNLRLDISSLTAGEEARARALVEDRFGNKEWVERV